MRLSAHFLASAADLAGCPADDEPEVAFCGRSNAGKSSALNRLAGAKRLARVSKTPGRTRLINFFAVAGGGRLVDLPGYGYAKVSQAMRTQWRGAIDSYLSHRPNLAAVVLIMDARRPLQPFDAQMLEWAQAANMPLLALLNKSDKLKRGAQRAAERGVAEQVASHENAEALLFSAQTGLGAEAATERIAAFLHGAAAGRAAAASAAAQPSAGQPASASTAAAPRPPRRRSGR